MTTREATEGEAGTHRQSPVLGVLLVFALLVLAPSTALAAVYVIATLSALIPIQTLIALLTFLVFASVTAGAVAAARSCFTGEPAGSRTLWITWLVISLILSVAGLGIAALGIAIIVWADGKSLDEGGGAVFFGMFMGPFGVLISGATGVCVAGAVAMLKQIRAPARGPVRSNIV